MNPSPQVDAFPSTFPCWSCSKDVPDQRTCPHCGRLQPVVPFWTHFDVLGVPRRMGLLRADVEAAFRRVSQQVHPDKFRNASAIERRLALQHTTAVNEAFQVLKDRRRTAEYLLSLEGVDVGAEEHRTQDPMLLMEMMEATESIDAAAEVDVLERMRAHHRSGRQDILASLERYFDHGEGTRSRAARQLERLRYLQRLDERIAGKLGEVSPT